MPDGMTENGALEEIDWSEDIDWESVPIENETDVEVSQVDVINALRNSPEMAALSEWATSTQTYRDATGRRKGSLIQRDKYVTPPGVFDQFALAAHAAEYDDVVSGVLDSTESLAFSKIKFDHDDEDQEDIWNQLNKLWNMDEFLRKAWRDLFVYSQFIVAMYPGTRNFTVRGKTSSGNKKRKTFKNVSVPVRFNLIDPLRVVPFGGVMFGNTQLAYLAKNQTEANKLDEVLANKSSTDPAKYMLVRKLGAEEFTPSMVSDLSDTRRVGGLHAYEMNPKYVFRHTDTKADYERFAPVKMKSIFELLDMKAQLRANDRSHLIGAANFIILIKKGSEKSPAKRAELEALKGYAKTLARMPLLIGDHRLSVEIVTPSTDQTLLPEKYNSLNAGITSRLYLLYSAGNYQSGTKTDTSITLTRMAARGLESRRHMMKRTVEGKIIDMIIQDNPEIFDEAPELRFQPASIALEFDTSRSQFMLELRARNELSRETLLTEFDFDQDDEAHRVEYEKERYDDIFETINPNNQGQPGSGVGPEGVPADTRQAGRSGGGIRNGGGASAGKGAGQPPRDGLGET